ncbi:MAG TPA: NAD-dependent epimerase/dehydratase family protein, partial [Burkholderiales bacterium]|nr:NAD-dependent epimerase/dehydratase family protein [Burkholderiales bacterium]
MKFDDVLVVGGAGFIGRHLVAALAARGIRVTVPSRRRESAKHLILLPTVDVIEADVMARGALERLAAGRQAVINLVGTLHGPNFSRVHVELPQAIVNACRAVGVKRLLHVSALGASPSAPSE